MNYAVLITAQFKTIDKSRWKGMSGKNKEEEFKWFKNIEKKFKGNEVNRR